MELGSRLSNYKQNFHLFERTLRAMLIKTALSWTVLSRTPKNIPGSHPLNAGGGPFLMTTRNAPPNSKIAPS